jgi:hypothetical protein
MISDVLSEAEDRIRSYLDHEHGSDGYGERGTPLRDWIESVTAQISALRRHLDAAPGHGPVIRGTCRQCGNTADLQSDYGSCAACIASARASIGELLARVDASRKLCPICVGHGFTRTDYFDGLPDDMPWAEARDLIIMRRELTLREDELRLDGLDTMPDGPD